MKKILIGIIALACFMVSSCYFVKPLEAEAKISNNTDKTFYYMVDYNMSLKTDAKAKKLAPHQTATETMEGIFTESNLKDSTEGFTFYYADEDTWNAAKEEFSFMSDWSLMETENCDRVELINKRSQKYKVTIDPKDGNNYSVTATFE